MAKHKMFRYMSLDELRQEIKNQAVNIDLSEDLSPLKNKVNVVFKGG